MLLFYGYTIHTGSIKQVKKLKRYSGSLCIGLFSVRNLQLIRQILLFLSDINMEKLSAIFFKAICHAIQHNKDFKNLVKNENFFPLWVATQSHMTPYKDIQDFSSSDEEEQQDSSSSSDDDEEQRRDSSSQEEQQNSSSSDNEEQRNSSEEDVEFEPWEEVEYTNPQFRGLYYSRNSCYIDSVLVALFAVPNKIIEKNILEKDILYISNSKKKWISCGTQDFQNRTQIQNELVRITKSFRGFEQVKDCTMLRKYLSCCPGSQEFHKYGMQDAGEFLLYLFNIFEVSIMTKHRITYVTNSMTKPPENILKTFEETQIASPVVNISHHKLKMFSEIDIEQFLNDIEDDRLSSNDFYRHPDNGVRYKRRIEITKIISTPYIVFNAQRLEITEGDERYISTKIVFPEKINIKKGKNLNLYCIVVHKSQHYTCYIKSGNFWYYYDDLHNSIKWIGLFSTMKASSPSPETNGILYFYTI